MEDHMEKAVRSTGLVLACFLFLAGCGLMEQKAPLIWLDPTVTMSYAGGRAGDAMIRFYAQIDCHPYSSTEELVALPDGLFFSYKVHDLSAFNLTQVKALQATTGGANEWSSEESCAEVSVPVMIEVDASRDVAAVDAIKLELTVEVGMHCGILQNEYVIRKVYDFTAL
jgi:hypothetical protein